MPNAAAQAPERLLDEAWKQLRAKQWKQAVRLSEIVLADDPANSAAARVLAIGLRAQGAAAPALEILEHSAALHPDDPYVWSDLGALRYEAKDWARAADAFAAFLRLRPDDLTALHGQAECLLRMHQYAEARLAFEACLRLDPNRLSFARSLSHCLVETGLLSEAESRIQQCLEREPNSSSSLLLLAGIRHRQFRLDEALELTEAAAAIDPDSFTARARLALANWNCGNLEKAVAERERALAHKATDPNLQANLTWLALHDPNQSAESLLALHASAARAWDRHAKSPPHSNSPDPAKRLRVGYLSGEFTSNPALCFLASWLRHHDRTQVETFYYMSRPSSPAATARCRTMADHWQDVWNLDDEEMADQIRRDGIDILVDFSGHFDDNRLGVFFQRPAPVQVAFPNYPSTTGVAEIDYILTDIWTTPAGCDAEYAEKPYRLPSGYLVYQPSVEAPPSGPLPALANGFVTFGMFQRPGKYHAKVWDAVAAVLKSVPDSRLLFHFESVDVDNENSAQRKRLAEILQARGIAPDRLLFRGSRSLAGHLQVIAETDIALDSFPYNGQTTACACLYMGVPVVTMRGASHVARVGQGLLERCGLGFLAGESEAGYVQAAVQLASNLEALAALRRELRTRISGPLMDGSRLAKEIENAYRFMWTQWCEGR